MAVLHVHSLASKDFHSQKPGSKVEKVPQYVKSGGGLVHKFIFEPSCLSRRLLGAFPFSGWYVILRFSYKKGGWASLTLNVKVVV